MSHFTHIIFDLDGTLTDNTQGIKNSLKYALNKMHIDDYREDILEGFIGPPLQWGFSTLLGMNERNTNLAVEYFREYYAENGWCENVPYKGIVEVMAELNAQGKKMYVATSKLEKFAQQIIRHFEMDKYIINLKGADYGGEKATKTQVLAGLLKAQQLLPSKGIVMVGDTTFDIVGGNENGLSTVAVGYGFGKKEDLMNANPAFYVKDVDELFDVLEG